jgi:hypothetical protein
MTAVLRGCHRGRSSADGSSWVKRRGRRRPPPPARQVGRAVSRGLIILGSWVRAPPALPSNTAAQDAVGPVGCTAAWSSPRATVRKLSARAAAAAASRRSATASGSSLNGPAYMSSVIAAEAGEHPLHCIHIGAGLHGLARRGVPQVVRRQSVLGQSVDQGTGERHRVAPVRLRGPLGHLVVQLDRGVHHLDPSLPGFVGRLRSSNCCTHHRSALPRDAQDRWTSSETCIAPAPPREHDVQHVRCSGRAPMEPRRGRSAIEGVPLFRSGSDLWRGALCPSSRAVCAPQHSWELRL